MTPTLLASPLSENISCKALPAEGTNFSKGGPSKNCVALGETSIAN